MQGAFLRKGGTRSLQEPGSSGLLTLSRLSALAVGSLLPTGRANFREGNWF